MKLALIRQRYTPFGGAERFMDRAITALGRDAEVTEVAVFAREWRGEAADYRFVECNPPHHGNVSRDRNFVEAVKALPPSRCSALQARLNGGRGKWRTGSWCQTSIRAGPAGRMAAAAAKSVSV